MFSVDFETLHQIIQQLLYTGVFRTQVIATRNFPEKGYIELHVKDGVIYDCYFVSNQGRIYTWDHRDSQLSQLGVLDWNLTQAQSPPSQMQTSSFTSEQKIGQNASVINIPSRVITLPLEQIQHWPTAYRQVYSLIDGKRQSANIAQILHKSQKEVEQIIDEFCHRGMIKI